MMAERLEELLVERAVRTVSDAEQSELAALLGRHPEVDADGFDRAAAAAALAFLAEEGDLEEELPGSLRQQIRGAAVDHLPAPRPMRTASFAKAATDVAPTPLPPPTPFRRREEVAEPRSGAGTALAWLAAAAALLVAVIGWWPRITAPTGEPIETAQQVEQVEPAAPTVVEQLAGATDLTVTPWSATEDAAAAGAGGEVAWSDSLQAGYMRIRGLAANDPAREQYQLWIFDGRRDDRYPVDGGVFDIPAEGDEVIVPIDAKLPIAAPVLFAVTVEPPGGVVVSSRERIVLAAQPEAAVG